MNLNPHQVDISKNPDLKITNLEITGVRAPNLLKRVGKRVGVLL